MEQAVMTVKGHNGQIELHQHKIKIVRKGVLAFMTQGLKGDKEIQIKQISSIQFKKAGMMFNGYIQFAFLGGTEAKGALLQATQDENTVVFTHKQLPEFEKLKSEIEKRMNASTDVASGASSNLDELEKLAGLRDKGIISSEEFDLKKKQLLGI